MKTSDLINRLTELVNVYGDLEVTITDGWEPRRYRTNEDYPFFDAVYYEEDENDAFIDIGIGGTFEKELN